MVEKRVVRILNCFWVAVGFSKIRTIKFLFVKKKQNLMDHSFSCTRLIGAKSVAYDQMCCYSRSKSC